ncbi:MAG: DUF5989 family protein [Phycisphaerae bacterium]|jgi:hypothetical protein|nr:DUF5989 family protein [Phycisphaerae bacterium]
MDKEPKTTDRRSDSFAEQADTRPPSFLRELWDFVCHNKKWWLIPILVVLLVVSLLVLLSTNSALAPFIYAIF